MPSGKTHEKINAAVLGIVALCLLTGVLYVSFGVHTAKSGLSALAGYVFGTYMFGPDLDTISRMYLRWGWFRLIWYPYRKCFKHRSVFTHSIILGDVVRFLYLAAMYYAVMFGIQWVQPEFASIVHETVAHQLEIHQTLFISFAAGVMLASAVHIISDFLVSSVKRKKRRRR